MAKIEIETGMTSGTSIQLLLDERTRLLNEVARIERWLASEGVHFQKPAVPTEPQRRMPPRGQRKIDLIIQVLSEAATPLKHRQILDGIMALGYPFQAKNAFNTLNPMLYGRKRDQRILQTPQGFILAGKVHK